ncbi:patatin-like phospholipase family protein [Hyphococcus luteus]|uniref:Patatin n=1 Tax=Hyphococcus luteus TaxID=2058213 RepID=A0A2S7K9N1_9PROT|nr:patatin-like phospholipase family protein [Marinicaulis flavus]PQA89220.1 patatin [Marinicaulis flavus]
MSVSEPGKDRSTCYILSLDGGGAKGFYTLGVLRELEGLLGTPLCQKFDLIFGTSTGSIIAALLAIGRSVEDVHDLYNEHVPRIMRAKSPSAKSLKLGEAGEAAVGDMRFDAVRTGLGIVAAKWQVETPMIFKSTPEQAHGRKATFVPGFGCTLSDAVQASSSAYPFFERKWVTTHQGDNVELVDGGYCANNPTLYALADAVAAFGVKPEQCHVLSLGTGNYPEPKPTLVKRVVKNLRSVQLLQKTLSVNTASMEQLRRVLFPQTPTVRIDDTFDHPEMATDFLEHDMAKLNLLRQRGAESFASREFEIVELLGERDGHS